VRRQLDKDTAGMQTEEKLDAISRDESSEQTVDICRNIRIAHIRVRTVRDRRRALV
jgi:hypothetical protein